MSSAVSTSHIRRPYSADLSSLTRLQSSNCPTILKYETQNPTLNPRPFTSTTDITNRPITASNATKMKFASLNQMRTLSGASTTRGRPSALNSVVSMDFLAAISRGPHEKFKDRSKIKPLKKLRTEDFHNIIYKVKSQKEGLEKEINQMEAWQREAKENDIWNTPQATIVNSILRLNAQANPQGNVSRLLNSEREQKNRESMVRASRRSNSRPQSSFFSKTPQKTLAKNSSVQDFFMTNEDPDADENLLQGIIGIKKQYHSQYDANKQKITEKINQYMDNMESFNSQINSNKGLITSRPTSANPRVSQGLIPTSLPITPILHNFPPQPPIQEDIADRRNESSEVLMQTEEGSEFESFNAGAMNQTPNGRNPHMIGLRHSNERYQLDGTSSRLSSQSGIGPVVTAGKPVAIHNRSHIARQSRVIPTTLASGLVASGEPKQQSVPKDIKYLPFVMEGQKMAIESNNQSLSKQNNFSISSKSAMGNDRFMDITLMTPKQSKSTKNLKTTLEYSQFKIIGLDNGAELQRHGNNKTAVRRPLTTRVGNGSASGNQTRVVKVDPHTNKINIDGVYFQNFAPKKQLNRSPKNNNVLNSWVTKGSNSNYGSHAASPRERK